MELSAKQRTLISRVAALVLGLALDYGGIRILLKAIELHSKWQRRFGDVDHNQREDSGAGHLLLFAVVLLIPGVIVTVLSVIPTRWLFKIPVGAPITHENPQPGVTPYL